MEIGNLNRESFLEKIENEEEKPKLINRIIGQWRQVESYGLDNFLEAEGGNWVYRKMAASTAPDFIYSQKDES